MTCTSHSAAQTVAPGDCIWVQVDKERAAIVIKKLPARSDDPPQTERWMVVAGTKTVRADPHLEIKPNSRTGLLLRLAHPTYFYAMGVAIIRESAPSRTCGRCLPSELYRLEEVIGERRPET